MTPMRGQTGFAFRSRWLVVGSRGAFSDGVNSYANLYPLGLMATFLEEGMIYKRYGQVRTDHRLPTTKRIAEIEKCEKASKPIKP